MKWLRLKKLIENYEERLPGHFVVIDTQKFRFRRAHLHVGGVDLGVDKTSKNSYAEVRS